MESNLAEGKLGQDLIHAEHDLVHLERLDMVIHGVQPCELGGVAANGAGLRDDLAIGKRQHGHVAKREALRVACRTTTMSEKQLKGSMGHGTTLPLTFAHSGPGTCSSMKSMPPILKHARGSIARPPKGK